MSNTTETFKLPSKSEIEALKKKYGELIQITVKDKTGDEFHCIIRKPKFADLQIASASEAVKKMSYSLSIWNNCKLSADPAIESNDYLFVKALEQINEMSEFTEGRITKL